MASSAPGRTCIFCGSRDNITKEHTLPRWLYRALGVGGPVTLMLGEDVVRTTRGLSETLREVCRDCNQGWLHEIEGSFRSVMLRALQGHIREPTVLNPEAQRVVATWAIKTWLLSERTHIRLRGMAIESPEELIALRRDNAPSESSRVWIGAVRIPDNTMNWLSSMLVRSADDDYVSGVVGVFTVGAVVFHIFGPVEPPPGRPARMLGMGPDMRDRFVPIWPNRPDDARWPPKTIFTLDELRTQWPGDRMMVLAGS